jgi:hypothetical protein
MAEKSEIDDTTMDLEIFNDKKKKTVKERKKYQKFYERLPSVNSDG